MEYDERHQRQVDTRLEHDAEDEQRYQQRQVDQRVGQIALRVATRHLVRGWRPREPDRRSGYPGLLVTPGHKLSFRYALPNH